jgi:hypothetical protein
MIPPLLQLLLGGDVSGLVLLFVSSCRSSCAASSPPSGTHSNSTKHFGNRGSAEGPSLPSNSARILFPPWIFGVQGLSCC